MDKKKLLTAGGIAAAAILLAAVIATVFTLNKGEETYRDISVFELTATANVMRDGTALDAYQGMRLENGDRIQVGEDGYIRLLLDNDKYVTLESGTEICLHATGDSADSKTEIELVRGAVLNEIDNKLSANSSYELSTPTSVMAVRGTVFRVALTQENEAVAVNLLVLDGQVAAAPVLADGTVSTQEILVNSGEALNINRADSQSDPECTPAEFSYEDLPADTLACILDIYQTGRLDSLSVSFEDLERLYTDKTTASDTGVNAPANAPADSTAPSEAPRTPAAEIPSAPADTHTNTSNTAASASHTTAPTVPVTQAPEAQTPSSTVDDTRTETITPTETVPDYSDNGSSDNTDDNSSNEDNSNQDHNTPDHKVYYTVTFLDDSDRLFGTQYVESGAQAQQPVLSPVNGSNWCDADNNVFDFNTAITKDLTLYYR